MDELLVAIASVGIMILIVIGGFVGASIKEDDFVKRMSAGMTPYVSTMKTLEWKSD